MLFSLICFSLCVYLGFCFSNKIKSEKKLIKGVIRFNKSMIINMEYDKKSLTDFIKEYKDEDIKQLLNNYVKQLKGGKEISVDIKDKALKAEIDSYFSALGKSNAQSQAEFAKGYEKTFQMHYDEFCAVANKKIVLYPKLGILLGGIIFIMLI